MATTTASPSTNVDTRINVLRRGLRKLVAIALLALAALAVLASNARAAPLPCDQTVNSTTGATITFTSVGQVYSLCLTIGTTSAPADDAVVYGVYSVQNTNAFYNAPIANTIGAAGNPQFNSLDYSPTTAKAAYTLHATNPNGNGVTANAGQSAIDITLNSMSTGGQDTVTLYYAPGCNDFGTFGCTGSQLASAPYVITIVLPGPKVTAISPTSGSASGGNSVIITGSNFTGTSGAGGVKFGAANATSYVVNSNTQITAVAPSGAVGSVDVTVTNGGTTSPTSAADVYTYIAAPTVSSVAPSAGPTGGGTTVVITGTNLSGATAVKFGATAATAFTVNSTTQITATSPAGGAGAVDITVNTAGGTSATSASDSFTYVAPPTVSSIAPISGPATGGTLVTITGSNFSSATAVTFGVTAATGFTVQSSTSITATSPAGSGLIDIRVTTPGGTSATSGADQFTYIPAPTVTAIAPGSGPQAGGTVVTITGTNFTGVTAVSFGATPATSFTFNSSTSITATAPAGSGVIDVRVTTPGGVSTISAADQFTYVGAPSVTSIAPSAGPTGGGTTVVITGTNLSGATAVKFGATAATAFTVNSTTQITATSPAGGAGAVDITVNTAGGTSATSASDSFTYVAPPTVSSIAPISGPATGGTLVTITGSNFSSATAVTFGVTAATGFTVQSSTSITATSPAGSGLIDIRVTTPGGTSATSGADQFTYIPAPTVTAIAPGSGPQAGGTVVTITGTNFTGATAVTFGATAATFTVQSSTSITTTSPAGSGLVDIRVTAPGGMSVTSAADQFTYIGPPVITSLAPTSGALAGGTSVTITGSGFSGASGVTFGAAAATAVTVVSATSITVTSPAGAAGTVDVKVTAPGGTSATSAADQFTYLTAPSVTAVSPAGGPLTGGTTVTITGTGFTGTTGAAGVKFGAANATSYTVTSATSISAVAPAGTGVVDITVTNPGGTSAISVSDRFNYTAAPTITSIAPTSGPAPGGTVVTLTGTGFTAATAVAFGAAPATSFTVNSPTSITATAPAGSGVVDIQVTTPGGVSATSAADQFTYNTAPAVSGIAPASGSASGGTSVTISGSGFAGTSGPAGVRFGTANAASYVVNSATTITAVSPVGTGAVDIIITAAGQVSAATPAGRFSYLAAATQTTLASSQNPSTAGQAVTFTATVSSAGAIPSGTVIFQDGGTAIGTATLAAGAATLSVSTLTAGLHSITAIFAGNASFVASTSPALAQTVNVPLDSVRLRAMQLNVTKMIAQNSGQAMSGAIFDAISEGFSEDAYLVLPSANGVRFNFTAEPRDDDDSTRSPGLSSYSQRSFGNRDDQASGRATVTGAGRGSTSRVDDAFAAIDRQTPRKTLHRWREDKQWLLWADVRTTGVDRWSSAPTAAGTNQFSQSSLYGRQLNALLGVTYKATPHILVGLVGGWETFDYTQQDINGRLKGDGWTTGAYLGWLITSALRYDAAVTFSGIGYQGSAGSAQGNFNGQRWMFATGLTGSHEMLGFLLEPSLRVYALWEHQAAYTDTLGTLQGTHDFASGRASAGLKGAYPLSWIDGIVLTPYLGIYGDF